MPGALLARVDDLMKRGVYASRAEALRAGMELIARLDDRRGVDRAIAEGYERVPPTRSEEEAALASLREAIGEEPW